MRTRKGIIWTGTALFTMLTTPVVAQLKVHSANMVTIGPTVTTPTERLEVKGNIRLLDNTNKLLIGDGNRYVGRVGADLGLISKEANYWMRIGSQGGIALWGGGPGAESSASPQMFLNTNGDLALGNNNWTEGFKLRVWGSSKGNGTWQVSDSKFKKDIRPIDSALEKVLKLKGCEYSYRKDEFPGFETYGDKALGFIAQEVKVVIPEAVDSPKDGSMSINYDMLIPLLVEAIKVQEQRIQELESSVATPKKVLIPGTSTGSRLDQSIPNPTNGTVAIDYFVAPESNSKIAITLTDMNGKLVQQLTGLVSGEQTTIIDLSHLKPGEYTYSLMVDNNMVATRKLTIIR